MGIRSAIFAQRFGAYLLLGEVSRGGMAEVQFALRPDRADRTMLAVKRILASHSQDPDYRKFFTAEIELSLVLDHPNVVRAVDSGEIDGILYLTMEYIHGRSLNRLLWTLTSQGKRLPIPFCAYIAIQALNGLHYLHTARDAEGRELGVISCDMSPSNIMVAYDGAVKLIDFGIATSRIRFSEQLGMLKGKKQYMAPEQLRGMPLDSRADIFAIGLCLYEMIAGESVFAGRTDFEIEEAVRSGRVPSLSTSQHKVALPHGLQGVVERALAADPYFRYANAAQFAAALTPFARLGRGSMLGPADVAKLLRTYAGPLVTQDDQRLAEARAVGHRTLQELPALGEGEG